MTRLLTILTAFSISLIACTNEAKQSFENSRKEDMKIHDEAMEEMDEIVAMTNDIEAIKTEIKAKANFSNRDSIILKTLNQEVSLLKRSEEAMMVWMRNYKEPSLETATKEEIESFFQKEKEKVTKVHQAIFKSLESGKELKEWYYKKTKRATN